MQPVLLLVKEQLLTGHDSHYAGGVHLFSCMADSLSRHQGISAVHTFSVAPKAVLMHHAVTHSLLHKLQTQHSSSGAEIVSWQQHSRLHHHFIVRQAPANSLPGSTSSQTGAASSSGVMHALLTAVADTAHTLATEGLAGCVILDVDMLQHATVPCNKQPCEVDEAAAAEAHQHLCKPTASGCGGQAHTQQDEPQQSQLQHRVRHQEQQLADIPFLLALSQQVQASQYPSTQTQRAGRSQQLLPHTAVPAADAGRAADGVACAATAAVAPNGSSAAPWCLLALVQNIYHLPFGPSGTAPRSPAVLQAWQGVAGVICVSNYVRQYLAQHAVPLLPQLQLPRSGMHVVHPAAFGVWGPGPFPNLGSTAAAGIWGSGSRLPRSNPDVPAASRQSEEAAQQKIWASGADIGMSASRDAVQGQQQQQQHKQGSHLQEQKPQLEHGGWQRSPVVGMLKLTEEKGSALFLALAQRLPGLNFLAVCAEPALQQQAFKSGLSNIRLIPPAADVSSILQGMDLLLVPSVLHEAFGMVVLDAMLHGLPVLVSTAGALPEAAAQAAAAALPVPLVHFTPDSAAASCCAACAAREHQSNLKEVAACQGVDCWQQGRRRWGSREVPCLQQQHVESWADAILEVLGSKEVYLQASRKGQAAALNQVNNVAQQGPQQLDALVCWLQQVCGGRAH